MGQRHYVAAFPSARHASRFCDDSGADGREQRAYRHEIRRHIIDKSAYASYNMCRHNQCPCIFAVNNLVPVAYNKIFTLRDDIGKTKEEINIPTGTFYDGIDGYVLRIDSKDDKTNMMHGILVYDHTAGKGNVSLTIADSAMLKMSKSKDYLTFQMFSGINYSETNKMNYRDTSLQLQKTNFRNQKMIIPLQNYAFQKSEQSKFGDQVRAMNLTQLGHGKDSLTHLNDSTWAVNTASFFSRRILRFANQLDTASHFQGTTLFDRSKLKNGAARRRNSARTAMPRIWQASIAPL